MYNILSQGKNVTVVIEDTATTYTPRIMFGGVLYDPQNGYTAVRKARMLQTS